MTANMIKGKGFGGALRYNLDKVERGVAEVLDHSFVLVSEKSIMKEIHMIKILRPNLAKFFYHTSINFPPNENLDNVKMKEIGNDYLKASGFDQHQFIMFRHGDADHPHLHILVNRIGYDGKVMSDSNDFARCENILRDLEKKHNLTAVLPSRQAKERAMTKDELEMMKRTNTPSHKMSLQVIINNILASKARQSCSEFVQALHEKGVNVLFNQASTGYVSGISYSYDGLTFTGSKLGNNFKWSTIKTSIDYEQERDRATIHEANARTKSINIDKRASSIHSGGDTKTLCLSSGERRRDSKQRSSNRRGFEKNTPSGDGCQQIIGIAGSTIGLPEFKTSNSPHDAHLESLLGSNCRNIGNADYQSVSHPQSLFKSKRKRFRRSKRA
ncbi:MAG: relaxase/mobilization nuclease domain-containing protein [Chryseolinea sp.]